MDDVFPFIGAVVVGLGALAVVYSRVLRARVLRGDIARLTLGQIALPLFDEYEDGALYPTVLTQCEARRNEPTTPDVINKFVCLDVAAGRYREAMAWHDVSVAPRNEPERLIALNVAEALACLGRLEDSLRATDWHAETDFLRAGVASHRAWVLSMLARTDEARAMLMPTHPLIPVLGKFQAEWYFSRFCIELAERKFDAAERALHDADACTQRESTRRNLSFLRAKLCIARGDLVGSLTHFARGAHSVYRWQGGDALAHWAETLTLLGRHDDARAVWSKCVAQDPQSPAAQRAREKLAG